MLGGSTKGLQDAGGDLGNASRLPMIHGPWKLLKTTSRSPPPFAVAVEVVDARTETEWLSIRWTSACCYDWERHRIRPSQSGEVRSGWGTVWSCLMEMSTFDSNERMVFIYANA